MVSDNEKQLSMHANLRVSSSIHQSMVDGVNCNESASDSNRSSTLSEGNQSISISDSSTSRGFYTSSSNVEKNSFLNINSGPTGSSLYGEILRGNGTVSAPPPGFSQRLEMFPPTGNRQRQQQSDLPTSLLSNSGAVSSATGLGFTKDESIAARRDITGRSSSFANLAAALGEGLAESMDDSCQDNNREILQPTTRYASQAQNQPLSSYQSNAMQLNSSSEHKYGTQDHRHISHPAARAYTSSLMLSAGGNNNGATCGESPSKNVLIGSSNQSGRIFQSTGNTSSTLNALHSGVDNMTVTGRNEDYGDSKVSRIDQRSYNNIIGDRSKSSTPSSLAQAVLQIKNSSAGPSSFSQNLDSSSMYSNESQDLFGSSLLRNQSSLLAHNELKYKRKETNGRSSAPPNLFVSSASKTQLHVLKQNHLNLQRVQSPAISYIPQTSTLDPRRATPSPLPSEPSHSATPSMLASDQDVIAEFELEPFVHDAITANKPAKACRGLVILGLSCILKTGKIGITEIQSTCEAFGALETFRTDFATTKGVIFFSYFNLLHAQHAAMELGGYLARFAGVDNATSLHGPRQSDFSIKVKYCIPLHSSASKDDSLILLSNLPSSTDEDSLTSMMESYGAVKAVHYQMVSNEQPQNNNPKGNGYNFDEEDESKESQSYTVEFFDIQDAKHALLELVNCQPLGEHVKIQRGMTNPSIRRKGIKLVTLLGKWRQGQGPQDRPTSFTPPISTTPPPQHHANDRTVNPSIPKSISPVPVVHPQNGLRPSVSPGPNFHSQHSPAPQAQLLISPDGQYSYVMVNPQNSQGGQVQHVLHQNHHPHFIPGTQVHNHPAIPQHPSSSQYWTVAHPMHQSSPYQTTHVVLQQPGVSAASPYLVQNGVVPLYANVASGNHVESHNTSGVSNGNHRTSSGKKGSSHSNKNRQSGDSSEENVRLALDINCVANGTDARSSLMVRNIPNKYTQQMLLAEFTEFGHGSDKIDFFYLPIDFKNRCNRGYAFINFVDYKDIIPFHEQYNNKQWRVFNSDKVCAITYARIQGKAAMLKRFEHSALLDKNDEYRPLVFTSHGVNKGKRENFPSTNTNDNENS